MTSRLFLFKVIDRSSLVPRSEAMIVHAQLSVCCFPNMEVEVHVQV